MKEKTGRNGTVTTRPVEVWELDNVQIKFSSRNIVTAIVTIAAVTAIGQGLGHMILGAARGMKKNVTFTAGEQDDEYREVHVDVVKNAGEPVTHSDISAKRQNTNSGAKKST